MAKFKTRARTVDMLGRQQIAGASTAISELFKNAHDAYADNVEVDHFRSDGLIVIRDDGYGMTKAEFEERWLVLGTDNKVAKPKDELRYVPGGCSPRAIMGEKGIGRLAIAILGRQVLILSRAKREEYLHDLVACYIHWGLFEIPGTNLEDIEIPIRTFSGGMLPNSNDVQELLTECKNSIYAMQNFGDGELYSSILNDIDQFQVDPENLNEFLSGLTLVEEGSGTHFYIAPANETISAEIDHEKKDQNKDFTKFLLGFCNSTFVDKSSPPIKAKFRDRITDDDPDELIEGGEFFTPEELEEADHHIVGNFDEYGQFRGKIRAYDQEYNDHVISWKDGLGKPTRCGPFKIEFAYVQGNQRESMMPPDDWKRIISKMDKIGGLYIYRDRIRVLPYGNTEFDWAAIEERRNRGAGYYFFSYRRMFGAICLTNDANPALREKAGREGFQEDRAYRQLKSIIMNFFIQLAVDFFREGQTEAADAIASKRKELEKKELARRRREKAVSTKKKKLSSELDVFFERVGRGLPAMEVDELKRQTDSRMRAATSMNDPDAASEALLGAERFAYKQLEQIRDRYVVKKPRGVGLSRAMTREWDAYNTEVEGMEKEIFAPFAEHIRKTLGVMAAEAKLLVDQRKRVQQLLDQLAEENIRKVRERKKEVNDRTDETTRKALRTASNALDELKQVVGEVNEDFAKQDFSRMEQIQIENLRERLEAKITEVGNRNVEILAGVRDMLASVVEHLNGDTDITQLDILESMESDLEGLKEQSDLDAELVQLGLAVAIINHEFEASIKSIRASLRGLHDWARANEELAPLYASIRNNFDHLDGHLNLFTPLQRRLYRRPILIKGSDIYHYIKTLFEVRLNRHSIEIRPSGTFLDSELEGYPSSIYPIFVNLIDNAIHWLNSVNSKRFIELDSDGSSYLIANNGSSIHKRDQEAIFEQGFSRKPGGRGLGLFISKKALNKEGMDLTLIPGKKEKNVIFKISWPKQSENESR